MFYDTRKNNHNLAHNPFKACVVPRPIAWITTKSEQNVVNLAPYSYFNAICDIPPMIMFASAQKKDGSVKDTITNIRANGEFVINIVAYSDRQSMHETSFPHNYNESETEIYNIKLQDSSLISVPGVASAPIKLECKLVRIVDLAFDEFKPRTEMVIGHVVGIEIKDDVIVDSMVDITKFKPITRLGYHEYAMIDSKFKIENK